MRSPSPTSSSAERAGRLSVVSPAARPTKRKLEPDRAWTASATFSKAERPGRIDVIWNDISDPHEPMGVHGIGEIGITGSAGAVANAVWHATGVRVRRFPIPIEDLVMAPR